MRALTAALLVLLPVAGCGCDPASRARQALDDARAAGAATYAPTELSRAQRTLEEAARSDGAARDRLHEQARALARAAVETSHARKARVEAAKAVAEERAVAREGASADASASVLRAERARVGEEVPLPSEVSLVDVKAASRRAFDPGSLVLDVRRTAARQERVPGAADAPPPVLAHARWPKDRELLLLGSGVGTRDVADAAGTLLRQGYERVSVIDGGVRGWIDAALPVEGKAAASDVPAVTPAELARELAGVVLVDVRDARSFAAGHLPGAIHLEGDALAHAASRALAGHRVVVYAASDEAARRAAAALVGAGHRDVRRLLGGVVAWARAGQRFDVSPADDEGTKLARRDGVGTDREVQP